MLVGGNTITSTPKTSTPKTSTTLNTLSSIWSTVPKRLLLFVLLFQNFYKHCFIRDQTPKKDILVVQGDWNDKFGKDAQADWGNVCGHYCNVETYERGLRLLGFAIFNNTFGPHKPSRRWTWHSPDGKHHNQIDYILVRNRFHP